MSGINLASVEPRCWWDGDLDEGAYRLALQSLEEAATQTQPDGRECAVCGGGDHQAFECEFNPLVMARLAVRRTVHRDGRGTCSPLPELSDAGEYRCHHCGLTPQTNAEAREHYGESKQEVPACLARTDPETIAAIVEAVREEEGDEQAEIMVRHLLRGAGCESDEEDEE